MADVRLFRGRLFLAAVLLLALAALQVETGGRLSADGSGGMSPAIPSFAASRLEPFTSPSPQLSVEEQSAQPNFPDTVEFILRASGFTAKRAALFYRVVGEARTTQVEAVTGGGETSRLDLRVTLDLAEGYIPPGANIEYYWQLVSAEGQAVESPTESFTLRDTRFPWTGAGDNGKSLSVWWYKGDAEFGNFLHNTALETIDRLEKTMSTKLERPINIWVYSSEDDLLSANPQGVAEWIGGRAFPEMGLILAAIANDAGARTEIKRIIPHELSHLLLYQVTRNPYNTPPTWLDEGLAVYNEESADPAYEAVLKDAAERGELQPLRALSGAFSSDEDAVTLDYAQSRSVIAFILNNPEYGSERFSRTIAAFREGVTADEALQRGLGITTDELDREWRASLPYKLVTPTPTPLQAAPSRPTTEDGDNTVVFLVLGVVLGLALAGATMGALLLLRKRGGK